MSLKEYVQHKTFCNRNRDWSEAQQALALCPDGPDKDEAYIEMYEKMEACTCGLDELLNSEQVRSSVGNSLEKFDVDGMPFRVGIKSIRDYFREHDKSQFEHWAYSYLNKLLTIELQNPEPSVATESDQGGADGKQHKQSL